MPKEREGSPKGTHQIPGAEAPVSFPVPDASSQLGGEAEPFENTPLEAGNREGEGQNPSIPEPSQDTEKQIFEVMPREQVGSVTGAKYEFQYHQAALDSLHVLDDAEAVCIYCEWHDDYTLETAGDGRYRFHQVKTRSRADGPWTINKFFGIRSRTPRAPAAADAAPAEPAGDDSIFLKMYDLVRTFGGRCEAFVFVTDAGLNREFQDLHASVLGSATLEGLPREVRQVLRKMHNALSASHPEIAEAVLFDFLSRLEIKEAVGSERDLDIAKDKLARRIYDLSEVDLRVTESQKIASDLVSMVRKKSHHCLGILPLNLDDLRATKGIVIQDILQLLSLSTEGYRELKAGGKESVVSLSRLHRYCKANKFPEAFVRRCCEFKTLWDEWNLKEKYMTDPLDLDALREECRSLLSFHQSEGFGMQKLFDEVKIITAKYEDKIVSSERLDSRHVLGLVLTLAIEAAP